MLDMHCHPEERSDEGSLWRSFASLRMTLKLAKRKAPDILNKLIPEEITAPLFSTEWGKRASWAVLVFFLLALGITTIQTVITWRGDLLLSRAVTTSSHSTIDNTSQLITHLPDEHLFGKIGVSDGEAVPITSLQLRLLGIVKTTNENNSRVIISEAGQTGKVYSIGDSLPSGITVNAITDDGVILENGGHMEKLPLHRTQLAFQGMPKSLLDDESSHEY